MTIHDRIFVLEKQIDLVIQFNLPIVLHCRDSHLYRKLSDCLKSRTSNKNLRLRWHCINSNADLRIVNLFLNEFPNSHIGINGSITYEINTENSTMFNNRAVNRSPFLPDRLLLETDYPYFQPQNLHGIYDLSCALLPTTVHLLKILNNSTHKIASYVHSSNTNIKAMCGL